MKHSKISKIQKTPNKIPKRIIDMTSYKVYVHSYISNDEKSLHERSIDNPDQPNT